MKSEGFTLRFLVLAFAVLAVASIASAQLGAAPQAVVVVYEDGTTVTVQPWHFAYFCESSFGVRPGYVRRIDFDDTRLLLRLGSRQEGKITVENNRLISAEDLRTIQWKYTTEPNRRSQVVSRVIVTLRNGEVLTLPRLEVSSQLAASVTGNEGARITFIHLAGKAKTSSGKTGDFLEPNLDRDGAGNTAVDTLVEIRFNPQGK